MAQLLEAISLAIFKSPFADSEEQKQLLAEVRQGNLKRLKELLNDPNVRVRNLGSRTPLHVACQEGHTLVADYLIQKGYDVREADPENGDYPVHEAARAHQNQVLALLLREGGASMLRLQNKAGMTPLHLACGNIDTIELLLASGAQVDAVNLKGETALHRCCFGHGYVDVIKLLLQKGSNVNALTKKSISPLSAACRAENLDIAILLLQQGAEPNLGDSFAITPLHFLCDRTLDEQYFQGLLVPMIENHGAEVNFTDRGGFTPLHYTSRRGNLEACKLLVTHGANFNAKTKLRITPLHLASCHGHLDIVKWLVEECKVPTHVASASNITPLDGARSGSRREVVEYLEKLTGQRQQMDASDQESLREELNITRTELARTAHRVDELELIIKELRERVSELEN